MQRTIAIFLFSIFSFIAAQAQDIVGDWNGTLQVGTTQLRLVLHVSKTPSGFSATMDSPDQGAFGIPVTTTTFENGKLKLEVATLHVEYNGVLADNKITGNFKQAGQEFPLDLVRATKKALLRPQEPAKPYPYLTEDITFKNSKDGISLAGTLTMPKSGAKFPAVILVSGSGPQNRDEEIFNHKPFLVLADHLTRNGIAVLRFDDRGVARSEGNFKTATIDDFMTDVKSAVDYLKSRKEIDASKVGLVGHSEGGIIAPSLAATSADLSFIVLLAAPGIPGNELLLLQKERIESQMGVPPAAVQANQKLLRGAYEIILATEADDPELQRKLTTYFQTGTGGQVPESQLNKIIDQISSPWMVGLLKYRPASVFQKVKCPVLAINGEKDLQVPAPENLGGIQSALTQAGNKKVTVKSFPNLNHLLQECKTGAIGEYAEIEQTISPLVLDEITRWLSSQVH